MILLSLFLLVAAPQTTSPVTIFQQCEAAEMRCNVEAKGYSARWQACIKPWAAMCRGATPKPTPEPK